MNGDKMSIVPFRSRGLLSPLAQVYNLLRTRTLIQIFFPLLMAHARFSVRFRYLPKKIAHDLFHLGTVLVIRRRSPAFLHQPLLDPIRPELRNYVRHDGFSPDSASKSSWDLNGRTSLVFFRMRSSFSVSGSRTHPLAIGNFRKDSGGAFDLTKLRQRGSVSE